MWLIRTNLNVKLRHSCTITGKSQKKQEISNHFNNFFINIGPTLAAKVPGPVCNYRVFLPDENPNSIFLNPTSGDEILKIIQSFKNGATGLDGFDATSLKSISQFVATPLAYLCNLSLTEGVFPQELKYTKVIPIYKSSDPMIFFKL